MSFLCSPFILISRSKNISNRVKTILSTHAISFKFRILGKTYRKWSKDGIVPTNIFDQVEWNCYIYLFQVAKKHFFTSIEYENYNKIVMDKNKFERMQYMTEFMSLRNDKFLLQARNVKTVHAAMVAGRQYNDIYFYAYFQLFLAS